MLDVLNAVHGVSAQGWSAAAGTLKAAAQCRAVLREGENERVGRLMTALRQQSRLRALDLEISDPPRAYISAAVQHTLPSMSQLTSLRLCEAAPGQGLRNAGKPQASCVQGPSLCMPVHERARCHRAELHLSVVVWRRPVPG